MNHARDIVVIDCKNSAHVATGTFNTTTYTIPVGNVAMQFTEGKFNNIKYTVVN